MHSIRSLHKMTSMRSIIRRKFSKDLPGKDHILTKAKYEVPDTIVMSKSRTVVKQLQHGPHQHLHIAQADLRKHLLSNKASDQGGYDSDAKVLDDIARNVSTSYPLSD